MDTFLVFKKSVDDQKNMKNYPACVELKSLTFILSIYFVLKMLSANEQADDSCNWW